jgi:exonuclease VII large subunit
MTNSSNIGIITRVQSSVVDVYFEGKIPAICNALECQNDSRLKLEVASHIGDGIVRTIAMDSTDFSHNQPALSVSELSQALKGVVENTFGDVRVRGEISGFKLAASGHLYFNLKDENAVLAAVCWKGVSQRFAFKPEEGLEVICTGKLSTYPGRSSYQIVIEFMEPAGAGALLAMLEKRKAMLAAEGLFLAERKKKLPYLPRTIGIITSPTGAVIKDMLHRLRERIRSLESVLESQKK